MRRVFLMLVLSPALPDAPLAAQITYHEDGRSARIDALDPHESKALEFRCGVSGDGYLYLVGLPMVGRLEAMLGDREITVGTIMSRPRHEEIIAAAGPDIILSVEVPVYRLRGESGGPLFVTDSTTTVRYPLDDLAEMAENIRRNCDPEPAPVCGMQEQVWYEGGTLHQATVATWNRSTDRNRLATAADWITTVQQNEYGRSSHPARPRLKELATKLRDCVTRAVEGMSSMRVSEAASICLVMMWGTKPPRP